MLDIMLRIAYLSAIGLSLYTSGWLLMKADKTRTTGALAACQVSIIIWCRPQLFSGLPMTEGMKYLAYGISYIGISFIGPAWLEFAFLYSRRKLGHGAELFLFGISAVNYSVLLTNEYHHLFYASFEVAQVVYGPVFYIHMAYTYICVLAGMAVVLADAAAVDSELRGEIQVIPLGNSYSVKAGDMVIGVGAPAGMVHSSVYGAITYVARNVPVTDGVSRILFTDLTSSGDAGTFILNLNGEMIGWTDNSLKGENSIVSESVMSISDYKGILEKMTNGAETAYFGIKGQEVSETMQAEGIPKGVYITDAVSGGPAYEAGLQNGDIIVQFDGRDVATLKELSTQIASFQLGNAAAVTVMRKGRDGYTSLEYQVTVRGR